jgi:serine/threonine-protein kinase RsbW
MAYLYNIARTKRDACGDARSFFKASPRGLGTQIGTGRLSGARDGTGYVSTPAGPNAAETLTLRDIEGQKETAARALANRRLQPLGHPSTDQWGRHGACRRVVDRDTCRVNSPRFRFSGLVRRKKAQKYSLYAAPEIDIIEVMRASLSLCSDPAELRRLVAFTAGFARRNALTRTEASRLSIILEELFTNAVNHGYEGEAGMGSIAVALTFDVGRLSIDFSDDGREFDPLSRPLPNLDGPAAGRRIGGLGLRIVRSLVDEAKHFRSGGRNHLVLTRVIAFEEDPFPESR